MKKYCRAGQATDDNMARLHCILDTFKNTHLDCIILIAFPLEQWLHKCSPLLSCMYLVCLVNPLPVQFKSLLHWQEGCIIFSRHLNLRACQYIWVRLARQATLKSSTFWYVRAGKRLNFIQFNGGLPGDRVEPECRNALRKEIQLCDNWT
jgi:hypothetical protein